MKRPSATSLRVESKIAHLRDLKKDNDADPRAAIQSALADAAPLR